MSKFSQDFSSARLKSQYKLVEGHIIEVGKIDLQELYNSMLSSSLDSILSAFLNPHVSEVADETVVCGYNSFDQLVESVNTFAESNGLEDLSFSDVLLRMIDTGSDNSKTDSISSGSSSDEACCGGETNV